MSKDEVAAALDEIGTLLELKGENPFRANAYHAASRTIQQMVGDLKQIVESGRLADLRGIGEGLRIDAVDQRCVGQYGACFHGLILVTRA